MFESWTGPKFEHPTCNCNICSSFTQRPSQSCLNHSQEPCEWVAADLGILWAEFEQILHLKVGCLNFGPVQGSAIYPTLDGRKLTVVGAPLTPNKQQTITLHWYTIMYVSKEAQQSIVMELTWHGKSKLTFVSENRHFGSIQCAVRNSFHSHKIP